MLGASLQVNAVPLYPSSSPEKPATAAGDRPGHPFGRYLRVVFSTLGGLTHEDAVVISQSAATRLRLDKKIIREVFIPPHATRVEVQVREGEDVKAGQRLVRAWIDLYALGYNYNDAAELQQLLNHPGVPGMNVPGVQGWLEIDLPRSRVRQAGRLLNITRRDLPLREITNGRAESLQFEIHSTPPARVGDKLATWHGIKGVIGHILPDEEMPPCGEGGERAEIVLTPVGVFRRGAMGQFREAAGGLIPE